MPSTAPVISVVIPIFNEYDALTTLFSRLEETLAGMDTTYEIIAVDDGSTDGSREVLRKLHQQDERIRVVLLSRNFGQSPALYAGFSKARGQYVVMIDADLQNQPEDIPRLIEKLQEGFLIGRRPKLDELAESTNVLAGPDLVGHGFNHFLHGVSGNRLHLAL